MKVWNLLSGVVLEELRNDDHKEITGMVSLPVRPALRVGCGCRLAGRH